MDSLGDRMKGYEAVASHSLLKKVPVIVRVDGRAFHTFTRQMRRPFDQAFITKMVEASIDTGKEMQGCKLVYVQSDEASFLLTDFETIQTEPWFGYVHSKVVSIAAALMSVHFDLSIIAETRPEPTTAHFGYKKAVFDARAFNVPRDDVANYFLWRAKDWARNSIQMYSQAHFSHKQLHGKGIVDMHEMLHTIGKNWTTDLDDQKKNGTFIVFGREQWAIKTDVLPHFESIDNLVEPLLQVKEEK